MSGELFLFRALGEGTKNSILSALSEKGEMCSCEIPSLAGISQPNCSMHLSKLKKWGLVRSRKEGRRKIYSLADGRVRDLLEISKKRGP